MVTLKATELVGAVSMLYAILLHQDSMSNDAPSNDMVLQSAVVNVIIATLRLFSRVCELNLEFFQVLYNVTCNENILPTFIQKFSRLFAPNFGTV